MHLVYKMIIALMVIIYLIVKKNSGMLNSIIKFTLGIEFLIDL